MSYQIFAFSWKVHPRIIPISLMPDYRRGSLLPTEAEAPLSVDEAIWDEISLDELRESHSGTWPTTNGADQRDSNDLTARIPNEWIQGVYPGLEQGAWLVAFVVTEQWADYLKGLTRKGLLYLIEATPFRLLESAGWNCLGWDVADHMLYSGLANSPFSEAEKIEIGNVYSRDLNAFGLFQHEDLAIKFALLCDGRIPDHHPFFPISIWRHPMSPS